MDAEHQVDRNASDEIVYADLSTSSPSLPRSTYAAIVATCQYMTTLHCTDDGSMMAWGVSV